MKKLNLLCLLLVFALSPVYVYAEKEKSTNKKQSVDNQSSFQSNIQPWLKIGFTPKERNIIKQYFDELITKGEKKSKIENKSLPGNKSKTKKKSLPPGLAKKLARGGTLPPGWQMKVARGEVMDYEVYSQGQLLPEEILKKLPLGPDGTVLLKIGGKVVRLLEATRTIVDLFDLQPNKPDK
jgi:hypothetical protein